MNVSSLLPFVPELIISFTSLLALIYKFQNRIKIQITTIAIFSSIAALTFLVVYAGIYKNPTPFIGEFDGFGSGLAVRVILLTSALITLILIYNLSSFNYIHHLHEYVAILLMCVLGLDVICIANDFITFYAALELYSISAYILCYFAKRSNLLVREASLKYFVYSSIGSALFLYGLSFIYGHVAALDFDSFAKFIQINKSAPHGLFSIGILMVIIGTLVKIGAAPFHFWLPDVYRASNIVIVKFFSVAPKLILLLVVVKIARISEGMVVNINVILHTVAILCMIIGSFAALRQTNLKKMLGYSSIAHVGYVLSIFNDLNATSPVALYSGTYYASYYFLVYMLSISLLFAILSIVSEFIREKSEISDFAGFSKYHPIYAIMITIALLSLSGIPPLPGFFAKMYIFKSLTQSGNYWTIGVMIISTIVSAFYYLNVIKVMYFDERKPDTEVKMFGLRSVMVGLLTSLILGMICLVIYPDEILSLLVL